MRVVGGGKCCVHVNHEMLRSSFPCPLYCQHSSHHPQTASQFDPAACCLTRTTRGRPGFFCFALHLYDFFCWARSGRAGASTPWTVSISSFLPSLCSNVSFNKRFPKTRKSCTVARLNSPKRKKIAERGGLNKKTLGWARKKLGEAHLFWEVERGILSRFTVCLCSVCVFTS